MSDLVRVRVNGVEKNVGRAHAERHGYLVLDEPTRKGDGSLRPATRSHGRPRKPKTSVAEAVAAKQDESPEPVTSTPEEANE